MARQRNRRGRLKKWAPYFFFFFLGVFLILGGYLYLTREKPPSQEEFSEKVILVDQIVRGQLYEMGIQKKNILLQQSSSRKAGGLTWKQSSLKVRVLRPRSFSSIEGDFKRSLSALGETVSIQSSETAESLRLEIKVLNRVTHQLIFVPSPPSTLKAALHPKIAIVIDDLGSKDKISQELLRWDLPITFAILPFAPFSKRLAGEAHRRGKEVILHLPMEPQGYPQIKGVSNHMGSRLMEDPEKIKIVFSELKRRGLFFLDNRTTAQTTGLQVAQSVGLKAVERSVFIDHSTTEEDIKGQLEQLIQVSLSRGKAIGIGHPHPSTIKSIKEMIPKMKEKGIEIVPLSAVME
jgi:polysaccharide deacetylase 2 family uncharacterized protein YibQ